MRPQLVQRQVAAAHTVIHGQHFQRFLGDPWRIVENVGNHVHCPAVSQHFISLGIWYREYVFLRHGLEAFTLGHGQFADNIETVRQFYGVLFALYGDLSVLDFIDRICFPVCCLNNKAALVPCGCHRIGFLVVPHFIGWTFTPAPPRHSRRHRIQAGGGPVRSAAVWPGLERDALSVHAINASALAAADLSAGVWHIAHPYRRCIKAGCRSRSAVRAGKCHAFAVWRIYPVWPAVEVFAIRCALNNPDPHRLRRTIEWKFPISCYRTSNGSLMRCH